MSQSSLRKFALFNGLDVAAEGELERLLRRVSYKAGDLILQEGGPSAGFYLVFNGLVQFGKLSTRRHRRRILKLIGPGEIFGEEALFQSEICSCPGYARTITNTSLAFLERKIFLNFLDCHPEVMKNLCCCLTRQIKVFECKLVELAYEPLEQNLLRLLLILMERFGSDDEYGIRINVPLSRQELADLLGAHLDTIIHELSHLRDQGFIRLRNHHIIITNPAQLRQLTEPTSICVEEKLF